MKFTLKDYQADAVAELLARLEEAKTQWHDDGKETAVALTAPTGAGKTVMAAATIEALFFGSDEFEFVSQPNSVVIWFSDNPNLNEQSRDRLMEASEKLGFGNMVIIRPPFPLRQLEPGKVYFLNSQLLGRGGKLVRGFNQEVDETQEAFFAATPDDQPFNIWDTIGNTIADEDLTVFLVLDEAHRGFNNPVRGKDTIVRQLVSGTNTGSVMPVVVGISATIERFKNAMDAAEVKGERKNLEPVEVEPRRVQESGLLKDVVKLVIPNEEGDFSTTLVRQAAETLRRSKRLWKAYSRKEQLADPVKPLLVLQVPNLQDNDEVGIWLDEIYAVFDDDPDFTGASVRHVLSDVAGAEHFGRWDVAKIEPQSVQTSADVMVLIAKEAISTGWDCPRAEVLISARPAKDQTHIAQLLGRMVRSPLARRVPGDEILNSVACYLPKFDRTTAGRVVRYITGGGDELLEGAIPRQTIEACEATPNETISEEVWKAYDELPSQTVPRRDTKPIKRLVQLSHALSADALEQSALADTCKTAHTLLDELAQTYKTEFDAAVEQVENVQLQQVEGDWESDSLRYHEVNVAANDRAIQVAFNDAIRVFGADIAQSYVTHILDTGAVADLRDAYLRTSALAITSGIAVKVDQFADGRAAELFELHDAAIAQLTDERRAAYEEIRALATLPQANALQRPKSKVEDYMVPPVDENGLPTPAPKAKKHILSDANGDFPIGALNNWERTAVEREVAREECVGWYRNPSNRGVDVFAIPYRDRFGGWRALHPDIIVFEKVDGKVWPSIVDPHATNLEDGRFKLEGLARFAEEFGDQFHRILSVASSGNNLRALDLKRSEVREKLIGFKGNLDDLYKSGLADDYC